MLLNPTIAILLSSHGSNAMKTIKLIFFISLFALSLLGSCVNMRSQPVDTYTLATASQQAASSVTHITQTPTLTPQGKIVTNEMILTAVASMAPPQSTPTPFPTLEFTPAGRIAYIDIEDTLHVMDGNGKNDVTTALPFGGGDFAWSPDGQTIVYFCFKINSLCFLDTGDFGQGDPGIRKVDILPPMSEKEYIKSLTWSPDSKAIAFLRYSEGDDNQLCVLTYKTMKMDCSSSNLILKGLPNDDLQIFSQATSVVWSPIDADLLITSSSGKLYLITLSQKSIEEIKTPEPLVYMDYMGRYIAWSPDGQRVAFSFLGMADSPINPKRICQNYACLDFPVPILATVNIDGTNYEKVLDGTDIFYRLPLEDLQYHFPPISTYGNYYHFKNPSWSPDGRFLLFVTEMSPRETTMHIRVFRVDLQTGYFVMLNDDRGPFLFSLPISWSP